MQNIKIRKSMIAKTKIGRKMPETIHLYQIDGGITYWEGYSDLSNDYLFSLDDDEVGDYISQNKDKDIRIYGQEPYNAMYHFHLEMDAFWGNDEYHVDDCKSLHDPRLPLDHSCQGCYIFKDWASKRFYGDYNKAIMTAKADISVGDGVSRHDPLCPDMRADHNKPPVSQCGWCEFATRVREDERGLQNV